MADELLAYNRNDFDHSALSASLSLPLEDEPFIQEWVLYAEEGKREGVFNALKKRMPQLNFPVREGISDTENYRRATRQGIVKTGTYPDEGLSLRNPGSLELTIHPTPAGRIPVIVAGDREDFAALLRALTFRNEPAPVPESQGATMIAGYNNWDRIRRHRERLKEDLGLLFSESAWSDEFRKMLPQKHLYQDRFILLSRSCYSGIQPARVGLGENEWLDTSILIRREHECSHYFTKRVLSIMQNRILDELIADYAGITAAAGRFRSDWFLLFVGLEDYPAYREGARLQNYRGTPRLSDGAFRILQALVFNAARNIEAYTETSQPAAATPGPVDPVYLALTRCTLEELASDGCIDILRRETAAFT